MSIDSTLTRRVMMAKEISPEKSFVPALLPWLIAAGSLIIYVVTINHWVSFSSIGNVAMVSGWNWQPELSRPLYWVVTYPFRWLPPNLIPLALNLFSALCAAVTLALLARSVALLPHDRTEEQRVREKSAFSLLSIRAAWLPPVLAVLVCGFQLSFWESATAASSEIFDLLLFAYVVRCLLEFRLYGAESWLLRAAFVFGASMTNNWAMIAFFPVFLAALIWVKGIGFFNMRFLRQMFFLGTAGLCFYLLLPIVASSSNPELGFWPALKLNLSTEKTYLFFFVFNKGILFQGDRPLWVLALPSLLPVLAMSFRWPSYFGDPSKLGVALATYVFHFLHGVLLLFCIWVALDPPVSPRTYAGLSALPLYYLGALSVGYYSGYFLLLFGGAPPMIRSRALPGYPALLNGLVTGGIWLLLLAVPAALLYRNFWQIRTTNGPLLRQFTEFMARDVPTQGAVVLSDDIQRLMLLHSAWAQKRVHPNSVLVDTRSLAWPSYHRFLHRHYPGRWTNTVDPDRRDTLQPSELQRLVVGLAQTNLLYYLHPSFGYYFEKFYPEAHRLVYQLKPYPTNSMVEPAPSQQLIDENQAFWGEFKASMVKKLEAAIESTPPKKNAKLHERLIQRAHLVKEPNRDAYALAIYCSRALTYWGVELQRNGRLPQAAEDFDLAKDLNADNVVAEVNLQSNHNLQAGRKSLIERTKSIEEQLGRYRTLQDVMNWNGPFDEATFCYALGQVYFEGGNHRQAGQQFQRVTELAPETGPENLAARLLLARASMLIGAPDEALNTIKEIHARGEALGVCRTNAPDLLQVEAIAFFLKRDTNSAEKVVQTALQTYPDDEYVLATASKLYLDTGLYSNALQTIDQQLKIQPDNAVALYNRGIAYLGLGLFTNAVEAFTPVVDMGTNIAPELYYRSLDSRGFAFWRSERLDEAQHDYEILQKAFPMAAQISYGLGEIAFKKKDTNSAIRNYQLFLANAPTNSEAASNVLNRLKDLRRGGGHH